MDGRAIVVTVALVSLGAALDEAVFVASAAPLDAGVVLVPPSEQAHSNVVHAISAQRP